MKYLVGKNYVSNLSINYYKTLFSDDVFRVRTKQKLPESSLVKLLKKGEYRYILKEDIGKKISEWEIDFFDLNMINSDFCNLIFLKSKYELPESILLMPLEKGKYNYTMNKELCDKSSFSCFCKLAKAIDFRAWFDYKISDGCIFKTKYKLPKLEGIEAIL